MTREEIKARWPILDRFTTLKQASKDDSKKVFMTQSGIEVINFDKIPNEFARGKGWPTVPKSNDALYIDASSWTFIEFKNGDVDKADVHRKIYDSILMLLELGIFPDLDYVRNNVRYILVCNKERFIGQKPTGLTEIQKHLQKLAKSEPILFELGKLKGYLLDEVHTYSLAEFEKNFVVPNEARIATEQES